MTSPIPSSITRNTSISAAPSRPNRGGTPGEGGSIGELGMTLEDNVMVNRFIEAMGAARYKTYCIYGKSIV